jgi:hypothetical protein
MADSSRAAPDFSRPIEALKACHERLRSQCAALRQLVDHVKDVGYDAQAQQAAGVMRYFDSAARHHHADEEEDLLPRMMAQASMHGAYRARGGQHLPAGRDAAVARGFRRDRRRHGAATRRRALLTAGFPPGVSFFQMKRPAPLLARAVPCGYSGEVT